MKFLKKLFDKKKRDAKKAEEAKSLAREIFEWIVILLCILAGFAMMAMVLFI